MKENLLFSKICWSAIYHVQDMWFSLLVQKSCTGSMVSVKEICLKNHTFQRRSQPELHNKPVGNILIPAAITATGGTYQSTKQFANALNLNFVNKDQFYQVQDDIVFPVMDDIYKKRQKDIIEAMKEEKKPSQICVAMVDPTVLVIMLNMEPVNRPLAELQRIMVV